MKKKKKKIVKAKENRMNGVEAFASCLLHHFSQFEMSEAINQIKKKEKSQPFSPDK